MAGKDQEQSWKKAIYKIIARMDDALPEFFKSPNWMEQLNDMWHDVLPECWELAWTNRMPCWSGSRRHGRELTPPPLRPPPPVAASSVSRPLFQQPLHHPYVQRSQRTPPPLQSPPLPLAPVQQSPLLQPQQPRHPQPKLQWTPSLPYMYMEWKSHHQNCIYYYKLSTTD